MTQSTERPMQSALEAGEAKLPLLFQEFSAMMAFFPVPIASLQALVPDRRLKLVPFRPGFSVVGIACLQYEKCDLGPYNEVGVFFPVRFRPKLNLPLIPLLFEESFKDMGAYIHRLPVTTQAALDAGKKFWGYPKFIADIEFTETSGWKTCRWTEGNQLVLELSTQILKPGPVRRRVIRTFSVLEGQLLATTFEEEGSLQATRKPDAARLSFGSHPHAEEIKAWKLQPRAIETRFFTQVQGRLNAAHSAEPVLAP